MTDAQNETASEAFRGALRLLPAPQVEGTAVLHKGKTHHLRFGNNDMVVSFSEVQMFPDIMLIRTANGEEEESVSNIFPIEVARAYYARLEKAGFKRM